MRHTIQNKTLIVIQGPTASGKTSLGIALAKYFKTVVISADSRQFYKEMTIGTAKPSKKEQDGIHHYFIDSHSIKKPLSAATFEKEALKIIEKEFQNHDKLILVGGSGMFIDALCNGLDDIPNNIRLRNELTDFVKKNGLENLLEELKIKDPNYYDFVDKKNPLRIIRAIEAIRISGKSYTELRQKQNKKRSFEIKRFVIDLPREKLYERINQRVDLMIKKGLIDEVKNLYSHRNLQTLNTLAYSEIFAHLDGKMDLKNTVDLIKQNTRRYAKRQLTWFRRNESNIWLKSQDTDDLLKEILEIVGFE